MNLSRGGVRNNLINNFNPLQLRLDGGALWENFLILERIKKIKYNRDRVNSYFWRTYSGAEMDYVEEINGKLTGYEMKLGKKPKAPASWKETYPEADFQGVNLENFTDFII